MNLADLIKKQPHLPPRILIYSTPGWGKTTLVSSMPSPVIIDAEDGALDDDVATIKASTYLEIEEALRALITEEHEYKTVIIDTTSAVEKMIFDVVCEEHNQKSINSFGYAKGYAFAMTYWEKIIDGMGKLREKGIATVFSAHSEIKTISSPTTDPYDKFILKMHKHPAGRLTEWADIILFGENRVIVAEVGEGFNKKMKGIGTGERVVYTEDRPAFLAKQKSGFSLPSEILIPKENGWKAVADVLKRP